MKDPVMLQKFFTSDAGRIPGTLIFLVGAFGMMVTMLGAPHGGGMQQAVMSGNSNCGGQISADYFGKEACDIGRALTGSSITFLSWH